MLLLTLTPAHSTRGLVFIQVIYRNTFHFCNSPSILASTILLFPGFGLLCPSSAEQVHSQTPTLAYCTLFVVCRKHRHAVDSDSEARASV